MRRPRPLTALTISVVLLALAAAGACGHTASSAAPPRTPAPAPAPTGPAASAAGPVEPDPHVGAVFLGATDTHTCAGAVLHSKTADLIVTAAHCLAGGNDITFVPGFAGTGGPAGTWTVNAIYLDPRWLATRDPRADFAIARVGPNGTDSLEARVGPGLTLGSTPQAGSDVTVTAYPLGTGGAPIACRAKTEMTPDGFPSLPCSGLVDGTSGAPWRSGSAVVGVIGGLHGGGCNDSVSYSSPFDAAVTQLLARAEARGPADTPPAVFTDDCP